MRFCVPNPDESAMGVGTDYPADFRERAEELRSVAAVVQGNRNREMLLECAADYEKLADQYQRASAQGGVFPFAQRQAKN